MRRCDSRVFVGAGTGLLLLALLSVPVGALQVPGLYSHRVAVMDQSDAERQRAFREAMRAVVLKVTGEQRWLEHPAIEQALGNARSYVEVIGYSSETISLPPAPVSGATPATGIPRTVEQRYIDVGFAATLIDGLLQELGIPVWDSNRPSVLVWMALQNAAGERSLLSVDANPEIIGHMQEFAAQRGVPIIFPVLDYEDRRNLSADTVWRLDQQAIEQASARYGADSMLAGRLHVSSSGELVGLWQFIFQDKAEVFDGFNTELKPYLFEPLDRITNRLASYFAILPEPSGRRYVRLRVEGVGDLQAYAELLGYLNGLGLVSSVHTAALEGEQLDLRLALQGNPEQLNELIALDRDLLPLRSARPESPDLLHYRWTR